MSAQPTIGSNAPAFKNAPVIGGTYPSGSTVSLADLKGRTVVLYFYPKDDTPGCTAQACALRDGWAEIVMQGRCLRRQRRLRQEP